MDLKQALASLVTASGITGNESAGAAKAAMDLFKPLAEAVWADGNGSVFAQVGNGSPVILVMAHNDEVGMMVTDIEDNGMLRLRSVAGVDPRILPGSEVVVYAKHPLNAVVGAIPPHLTGGSDRDKAYKMDDLVCDTGLSTEKVRSLVSVGDFVTFAPLEPLELKNGRVSSKTMDDRALVAMLALLLEQAGKRRLHGTLVVCASSQEEKTGLGAITGARQIRPDIAIAADVTHPFDKRDIGKLGISCGCNIHPKIYQGLCAVGDAFRIPYEPEVEMGPTGTDAWDMQVQCGGVPTGLIDVPLMYMHTSVETIETDMLRQCAQLIIEYAASLNEHWEEQLCLDD